MLKKILFVTSCLFFLAVKSSSCLDGPSTTEHIQTVKPSAEQFPRYQTPFRLSILKPEEISESLNIKPGMVIADIGAGTGLFTFKFAEELKGTGMVYAIDILGSNVDYIRKEITKRKYKNILPVLVKPFGVDPFFNDKSFDIIFLCDTYEYLHKPREYFEQLKSSLKKSTGRLFIVYFNDNSDFGRYEFSNFKQVVKILVANGEDFPIFRRLRKDIQDFFIKNGRYYMMNAIREDNIPEDIKKGIIEDFNNMLYDGKLPVELISYYETKETKNRLLGYINRDYKELAAWLIKYLDGHGVFDARTNDISSEDKKFLHKLNKIIISGIYSTMPIYAGSESIYYDKNKVISQLNQAGYSLVKEHGILDYHYLLEFKRGD